MYEIPKGALFCMGNPLLDISAEVDQTFLDKYNLKANDAVLAEKHHLPIYSELKEKSKLEYIAGGATQNTCRVFQWVVRKADRCVFMGCIGRDEFGEILKCKAREAGVDVHYQFDETTPTGTCAVLLTDGGKHRSLCANLAAANNFSVEHLKKPENLKLMCSARLYYISGFFLTVSVDSMVLVGQHATSENKLFCMNLSAPFLCQFFHDQMMKVMPYVDILFGNEAEAKELACSQKWPETLSIKDIARKAAFLPKERGKRMVIFTQGTDPVIVVQQDGSVQEYPVKQIAKDKIVDTNGAGDAFVGGFLAGLIEAKSIASCVARGIAAASMMIQQSGCSLPNRDSFCDPCAN
ncbi:adenosine kinase-like [Tropilaelaps mercedesae]|uniref:Adenosine kinase n=1 Tax=Tropilaelaps mercedesae TaxID=418985 RepID=A0A1V9XDH7_9ACAR|nr:adenosine kinase-like [Tropilaelaps mercedesae]